MPTQLEDLRGLTVDRLREMRLHPGVYSRALIAQALDARNPETMDTPPDALDAPRPEGERPSIFRQDVQRGLSSVAPLYYGAEKWLGQQFGNDARDARQRMAVLDQMRMAQPGNAGPLEYFNRQNPEREQGRSIRSFLDQNADMLAASPREFEAFVANPAGYVQMKQRVLTPRDAPQQAMPPEMAAQGDTTMTGGGEQPVESVPAPYLPPLQGPVESIPAPYLPPLQQAQQQPDIPPWLRPREAQTGAVGEGGSTAGGRQTPRPAGLAAPTQSPAIAAIATGQQAAAATVAPEAAAVSQAVDGMSPELKQATADYMKILGEDSDTKQQDQFMSLAKAGFATAASRSPYLLQAIGEGGLAGIDDYQRSRGRQAERRLRGAEGRLRVADIGERARATMRDDVRADKTLAETVLGNRNQEIDRAAGRTNQANTLAEHVRQFGISQTTENKKIDADAARNEAQADYYRAFADATRSGARFAGSQHTPARIAEAKALVEMGAAPDEVAAYKMVRSGVNDYAQYQRIIQAEKKALGGQMGNFRLTDDELEEMAIRNVEKRAGRGGPPVPSGTAAPATPTPGAVIRYDSRGNRLP